MFVVYVLENDQGIKYTGYTSNLEKRLWQHNNGITKTTNRLGKNWKIVYTQQFTNKIDAIKYEKFLKTGKGREFIKKYCGMV